MGEFTEPHKNEYELPDSWMLEGIVDDKVMAELSLEKEGDTPYEKVLSSMCTYPHPVALRAHLLYMEANLGDAGLFSATSGIENKVVQMCGELAGGRDVWGFSTTGGTESNIQAVRVAKARWLANHSISRDKPTPLLNMVIPESAHFSFEKVKSLTGIELRYAPMDEDMRVDVGEVERLCDEHTCGILGIAGTTEFGSVDPIPELAALADELGVFMHVDAAFGGFVLPFLGKHGWGFQKGVCSVSIDPHKMGLSTIPCGTIAFSRPSGEELSVQTPYLTVDNQPTLSGTRSGGAVVGAYAVMRTLGWEGYERVVDGCMRTTHILKEGVEELGLDPVIEPECNVLVFSSKHPDRVKDALYHKGWSTSTSRSPHAVRCVLMPHTTEQLVLEFLDDLRNVVKDVE
ncbi:MAG: tyrosine decarboxylase MfnA [Methermicoccaceae archaeon]